MELFNWLSNLKNVVLSNGSKNVRNVIQMALILKELFFAKRLGASSPDPHSLLRLETLPPKLLSATRFSNTSQLTTSPNSDILEKLLKFLLKVYPFSKIKVMCHTHRSWLLAFLCTVSLSHKNPNF